MTRAAIGRDARVDSGIELAITLVSLGYFTQDRLEVARTPRAARTNCWTVSLSGRTRVDPEIAIASMTAEDGAGAIGVGGVAELTAGIFGRTTTFECPGGDAHRAFRARFGRVRRTARQWLVAHRSPAASDSQSRSD